MSKIAEEMVEAIWAGLQQKLAGEDKKVFYISLLSFFTSPI